MIARCPTVAMVGGRLLLIRSICVVTDFAVKVSVSGAAITGLVQIICEGLCTPISSPPLVRAISYEIAYLARGLVAKGRHGSDLPTLPRALRRNVKSKATLVS
jgi:hypothetical protein